MNIKHKAAWQDPQLQKLGVQSTLGGFLKVNFEGPFNFLFGDSRPPLS